MANEIFEYAHLLVKLLWTSGKSYTDIANGASISYPIVLKVAKRESDRISVEVIKKIEDYAKRVAEGEE